MAASPGQLVVEIGGALVQAVPLGPAPLTIGRAPDNALTLPHPEVSRHHAELRLDPAGLLLTDVGSSFGTFVEGQLLLPHQPRVLTSGTTFAIGPFQLTYRSGADAEPIAAAIPDADPAMVPEAREAVVAPVAVASAPPRPAWPASPVAGPTSRYLDYLPAILQSSDFLGRLLLLFESLWEPLELRQDYIDRYFDPRTCPAGFLGWLGSWLDVSVNAHWPEARVRNLLAEAMDLYRWRGTPYGLTRMLEVCTGLSARVDDDPRQPHVFRVGITAPAGQVVDRQLVEELIQAHKPAHAGYTLEVTP